MERVYTIYLLECFADMVYVGVTSNLERRWTQHKTGKGASFTKRYEPKRLVDSIEIGKMTYEEAEKYEDAYALECIFQYGMNRCRGGHFFRAMPQKELRRIYNNIDDRYKHIRKIVRLPKTPKHIRDNERKKGWDDMEMLAKYQLSRSARELSYPRGYRR